jgi:hypothetical protein
MSTASPGNTQYSVCGSGGLQVILAVPGVQGPTATVSGAGTGTVTSVGLSVPSGLAVSGSPVTTSGTLAVTFASGHSIPTTASQANWDTAYSERRQWDGGATNLDAATGRTSLGLGTGDAPVFAGITVSGTANLPHIHGALAGVLYEHVRNTSGAPISALTPYHITGSQGDTDRVTIEPAQANNAALMPAAGITYGALSTNEDGHGAVGGVITGLNTIGFQSGDPVYVAPSGGLTATRPASGIVQAVGVIGRVHANTGSMAVLIGSALQAVAFSGAYGDLSGRPTIPSGADAVPQALGTAAVGVSNDYAREDHVHTMPTAGQVGADAAGTAVATVSGHVAAADPHTQYALESSLATVATSGAYGDLSGRPAIPSGADAVPQALGIAAVGVSSDYAREDHVHAMPTAADVGAAASGHVHGNITNAGAIGSVSGVPIITSTSGVLQAGSFGTASGTFAQGNDARFHDAVSLAASVADILSLSGQELQADDPGADRLLFWDDSEGKLTHATLGPGIVFDGTTLRAEDSPWMALGDESTAATSGIKLTVHHWPSTHRLTAIPLWSATAPVTSALQVDIRVGGTSIFSTLPTIAVGGTSSTTTTPAVFSTAFVSGGQQIAAGSVVTFHVTQPPAGGGGAGLKVQMPAVRI